MIDPRVGGRLGGLELGGVITGGVAPPLGVAGLRLTGFLVLGT